MLIKELQIRSDVKKCLIIVPGSLADQWKLELEDKFSMDFEIFQKSSIDSSFKNPFKEKNKLICRIDQISRNENLLTKLKDAHWDLVVVDEAHKMSANIFGNKLNKTKRYQLGEMLSKNTRHFLLMTATPHNGKREDFELFLSLLDADRFYYRKGIELNSSVDNSDIIRKIVKEDLVDFEGNKLFPKRESRTIQFKLSNEEMDLYSKVTNYVREEMNKADKKTDGKRKNTIGFALTILQRRLASSPLAIHASLGRRIQKLQNKLDNAKNVPIVTVDRFDFEDEDSFTSKEKDEEIENIANQETASDTTDELKKEIHILKGLKRDSENLIHSQNDVKWNELKSALSTNIDGYNQRPKMVIFTENKDTLQYLEKRLKNEFGDRSVVYIHGGVSREARMVVQQKFKNNKETFILLGTDAAGEGINLQCANFVLNYDIPWNPNRIEQRFGRVHRIGQKKECYLFNFVAQNTREGLVFERLLKKIDSIKEQMGDKIYDILGEIVSEKDMKNILIDTIRSKADPINDPRVKMEIDRKIENLWKIEKIKKIEEEHSLIKERSMSFDDAIKVKHEMNKAKARKLQPYFISSFFEKAFTILNGKINSLKNQDGVFNVQKVPEKIINESIRIGKPLIQSYDKIVFDRVSEDNQNEFEFIHLGHSLLDSTVNLILKQKKEILEKGTIFIDPNDFGDQLRVLVIIEHTLQQNDGNDISKKMIFVNIYKDETSSIDVQAPYIDLKEIDQNNEYIKKIN